MFRKSREILTNLTVAVALLASLDAVVRQDKSVAHAALMALNAESGIVHAQGTIPDPTEVPGSTIPVLPPIDITPTPVTGPNIDRLEVLVVDQYGEKVTDAQVKAHTHNPDYQVETGTFTDGGGKFVMNSFGGPMQVEITGGNIATITHQIDVGSANTLEGISIAKTGEITATMDLTTTNRETDGIGAAMAPIDITGEVSDDSLHITYPDNSEVEVTDLDGDGEIAITTEAAASSMGTQSAKEVTIFAAPDADGYTVAIRKGTKEVTYRASGSQANSNLTFNPEELAAQDQITIQVDADGNGTIDSTVTIPVSEQELTRQTYLPLMITAE